MYPYFYHFVSRITAIWDASLNGSDRKNSGGTRPLNCKPKDDGISSQLVARALGWGMCYLVVGGISLGCSGGPESSSPAPAVSVSPGSSEEPDDSFTEADGSGILILTANGEDFVRQGMVSKDGWAIAFDHVYLTLTDVVAYQTDPTYDSKTGPEITNVTQKVTVQEGPITVDLAAGDANAEPIVVNTVSAPAGHYNALSWTLIPDPSGDPKGYSIHLLGTATKAEQTIQFSIGLDETYYYSCGEFIGDSRKGILKNDQSTNVEITLHFDHIFGNGDLGNEDSNEDFLGFAPLAALSQDNRLNVDSSSLKTALSPEHLDQLYDASYGLGHVGEGHCAVP